MVCCQQCQSVALVLWAEVGENSFFWFALFIAAVAAPSPGSAARCVWQCRGFLLLLLLAPGCHRGGGGGRQGEAVRRGLSCLHCLAASALPLCFLLLP